jgi:hypothetical protein
MPTGYTADVGDGKVTDFAEFAMTCARAFGALVTLRDSPDAEIPDRFEPSDYHTEKLVEAKVRGAELERMPDWQADAAADAAYRAATNRWREHERKVYETKQRYEDMLLQVHHWDPPTDDHRGLKKFMIEQLQDSITFDCSSLPVPQRQTGEEWRSHELERVSWDLTYHEEQLAKEIERAEERTRWVRELRESLGAKC